MSCDKCNEYNKGQHGIAYYRWKGANIGMMGCEHHLQMIFDVLNREQRIRKDFDKFIKDLSEEKEDNPTKENEEKNNG